MTKHERKVLEIIKRNGCEILECRKCRHWVYRLRSAAGKLVTLTVSVSPSDRNFYKLKEQDLRRALRTC